jgi:hypothetical protein
MRVPFARASRVESAKAADQDRNEREKLVRWIKERDNVWRVVYAE